MNNHDPEIPNPYAAPTVDDLQSTAPFHRTGSMVNQVRIVAILMIVQASLELLFSIYLIAMSFWFPWLMAQQPQNQMPVEQQQAVQQVQQFTYYYFAIGGVLILIVGLMRLSAGILGFQFRGRILGIASHFLGLVSIATCYCLPTAVGVCVYGSIVYFNRDVVHAFAMKKSGSSNADILHFFNR